MFDLQKFVQSCRAAISDPKPAQKVEALVQEAILDPDAIREAFAAAGNVERMGPVTFAARNPDLSVADVTTPPGLRSPAHNHKMWAVIGVYEGEEHNKFFVSKNGGLEEKGERLLKEGDVIILGPEAIHAISNPISTLSGAIHVYGGDLIERPERDMWNPHTGEREEYDMARLMKYTSELSPGMSVGSGSGQN